MAAQNNAQTIALQLEKVRDKVPLLYERDDVLLSMIQTRGDVEKVSSRNMRLPLQLVPGGKAGSYSADGGDLGRGTCPAGGPGNRPGSEGPGPGDWFEPRRPTKSRSVCGAPRESSRKAPARNTSTQTSPQCGAASAQLRGRCGNAE